MTAHSLSLLEELDFSQIVEDHKWLALQYSAFCAHVMKDWKNTEIQNSELIHEIEIAMVMAEFLEHIYSHFMDEKDEIALMRHHQAEYRKMLRALGRTMIDEVPVAATSDSSSKFIHDNISTANRYRLFTVRVRRLFITTAAVLSDFDVYCNWIHWIEEQTGPAFAYLAWMTLFPRLLKNLFILGKHLLPLWWMDDKESALYASTRFNAQLERHWFELGNDIVTISVGLVNCFILTGSANLHLGIALLAFDVALASWRARYELRRLREIEADYARMPAESMTSSDIEYLAFLRKRIDYEVLRHRIAVANTVLLLLSTSLTLPVFAFNVVIPLIGAAGAVLTTIANFVATQYIEQYKPNDKVLFTERTFSTNIPLATSEGISQRSSVSSDHLYGGIHQQLSDMDSTNPPLKEGANGSIYPEFPPSPSKEVYNPFGMFTSKEDTTDSGFASAINTAELPSLA